MTPRRATTDARRAARRAAARRLRRARRARDAGGRARHRRDAAHELHVDGHAPRPAVCRASTSRRSTSATGSSSPTTPGTTSSCSGTTTSPTCASARAACSRTSRARRRTSTAASPRRRAPPAVGRLDRAAGVATRVGRHRRALARPPVALDGHRGPARGAARPRPPPGDRPLGRCRCAPAATRSSVHGVTRLGAAAVAVAVPSSPRSRSPALVIGLSRTRRWRTVLVVALGALVVCSVDAHRRALARQHGGRSARS